MDGPSHRRTLRRIRGALTRARQRKSKPNRFDESPTEVSRCTLQMQGCRGSPVVRTSSTWRLWPFRVLCALLEAREEARRYAVCAALSQRKNELMLLESKLLAWNFWHRGCCQPQSKLTQTWDGNDASRRGGTTRYKSVTDEIVFDPGNFGAFSFWNASPDLSLRGVRSSAAQRVRMPTPHISAAPGDFAEATAARPRHLSRRWQDAHSGSAI